MFVSCEFVLFNLVLNSFQSLLYRSVDSLLLVLLLLSQRLNRINLNRFLGNQEQNIFLTNDVGQLLSVLALVLRNQCQWLIFSLLLSQIQNVLNFQFLNHFNKQLIIFKLLSNVYMLSGINLIQLNHSILLASNHSIIH